jgi:hypothetical protein
MDETLHPSTLSEILDRTAQLYRSRFLVFFGIACIPTATLLVFAGAVALFAVHFGSSTAGGIVSILASAALTLVGLPVLLVATSLATAALNHAAARSVFGQPITIRDSYRAVWLRGWRYIGLFVVQTVAVWVVPFAAWFMLVLIAAGLAAVAQSAGLGGGGLFAFAAMVVILGLVVYGFWISLRLSLGFPACVVEQSGAWAALKRSWSLGTGSRGRILVLYLLGIALNWILSIAIWVPFLVLLELLPGEESQKYQPAFMTVRLLVVYGAGFAVQAFTRPVYGIALILFYYDQRIRKEGFDIEWMMLQAGLVAPVPAPDQTQLPPLSRPAAEPAAGELPRSISDGPDPAVPAPFSPDPFATDPFSPDPLSPDSFAPELPAPAPIAPNPLQPTPGDRL